VDDGNSRCRLDAERHVCYQQDLLETFLGGRTKNEESFLAGLSVEEITQILDVSVRTVNRDWNLARAWLYRQLTQNAKQEVRPVAQAEGSV
jgi:hypothetical protein